MERPNNVIMWAAQTRQVADAIKCDGVSREQLFEISDVEEQYVQGAVWCIKKVWIEEIIE